MVGWYAKGVQVWLVTLALGAISAPVASGCGGTLGAGLACEGALAIRLKAAADLNPSATGQPLPTQVRFVQLTRADAANHLSFDAFWDGSDTPGKAALGSDLVSATTVTVLPDSTLDHWVEFEPATRFLMLAALVRHPQHGSWRITRAVPRAPTRCALSQHRPLHTFLLADHWLDPPPNDDRIQRPPKEPLP